MKAQQVTLPTNAALLGCVTKSRDEVKAWVRANARALHTLAGGEFDKEVYREMLAALRPLMDSPPLNTVMICPESDEETMTGLMMRLPEQSGAGGILRVRVLALKVYVLIGDATSDE